MLQLLQVWGSTDVKIDVPYLLELLVEDNICDIPENLLLWPLCLSQPLPDDLHHVVDVHLPLVLQHYGIGSLF